MKKLMRFAFKQDRRSISIHGWPWNELLQEQTSELKHKLFNHF